MAENGNEFLGRGWSFPPAFNAPQQTVMLTEKQADIECSLHVLLTTRVGERVMQPKYGCNMDDMVFESLNTATITLIKDKIATAILYFEPRIDVKKINLNTDNLLEGTILVEIDYLVRATNSRFNFVFPYFRLEGTELQFLTTNNTTAL
ncbi:MAG: GPW/gp25 family protein [Bacteroidetes bacterium]|nr:GPW/gp25 family protein [Bacteroidota bacterium]MBS1630596.1 GPW/gp25 family protein [Bacteroidota bacterium]